MAARLGIILSVCRQNLLDKLAMDLREGVATENLVRNDGTLQVCYWNSLCG